MAVRNSIQSKPGGSQNSAGVAKSFELGMFLSGDGETPGAHSNLEMVAQLVKERSMFLVPLLVTKPKLLTEKQMHKLKVSSYVLSGDLTQDYNLGDRIPESSEELFQRVFPLYFSEQLKKENEQFKKEIERKKAQFKSAWREIPLYADWRKEEFQTVNLTLDAATAHPALFLSEEGRRVTWQEPCQELPSCPERFVSIPCVLGQLHVSSERYFWEVEVQDTHSWDLGVCRNNVARKGRVTVSPQNGFWAIRLYDGEYWGLTSPETSLTLKEKLCRVGVFVDYKAGDVSFYNMTDGSHIYTFSKQAFYGGLRPLFRLWSSDSGPLTIVQVD
ncbi:butyrophilin subfamily 1 member A1-like [Bos javanicus]|uniref:butyrophilin subfamily 1 member A1-like n=1 Tax=Bos javanicus TaxID=9906 RepID=UPI002AA905F9|nr:butyrophilin subfamily 1 member A1-like [Bos javanicus]